jgi:hypothetical protein
MVLAVVMSLSSLAANALVIPYTIELTPNSGPSGSGIFDWDSSTAVVSNFTLTLGSVGPFGGGANDGAPVMLGPVFNGSSFTSQVSLLYSPYFDLRFETDGSYFDTNGRIDGLYRTAAAAAAVPAPAALALLVLGLPGISLARRGVRTRCPVSLN